MTVMRSPDDRINVPKTRSQIKIAKRRNPKSRINIPSRKNQENPAKLKKREGSPKKRRRKNQRRNTKNKSYLVVFLYHEEIQNEVGDEG